jgi:adenylate cyclase
LGAFRFGRFELWPAERLLLADGVRQRVGDRAFDLLCLLVERHGRLVEKDELLDQAWPGRPVAENNLTVQVSALRKVLGAGVVRTVAGRGYQLALPVEAPMSLPDAPPGAPASAPPETTGLPAAPARVPSPPLPGRGLRRLPEPPRASAEPWLRRESPVLLCLLLTLPDHAGAPDPAVAARLDALVQALVPAHGGSLLPAPRPRWLASFYGLRDALACGRQLQQALAPQAPDLGGARSPVLQLALHRIDRHPRQATDLAARLAALALPGQILASAEVAGRFIPALDGDLVDLGEQHLGLQLGPQRVYALLPDEAGAGPGRVLPRPGALRPALALIPPRGLDGSGEADMLGDIVADQLIAALSRSPVLAVTSRLSTRPLRQRALSAEQVGRLLGAQFVVSGHCVRSSGRLRVHLEVADGRTGRVLGACQAEDADHAALQTDSTLVQALVAELGRLVLRHELVAARTAPLPTLETHTLLLAAIGLMFRLVPGDVAEARQLLDEVCRRAPHHAAPLAWLARWHLFRLVQGGAAHREADGRAALALAQRALDIDPESPLALTMLAAARTSWSRDLDGAATACDAALAINPSESLAWLQRGAVQAFDGAGAEALASSQRAWQLSPLDPARPWYRSLMASAALTAGDHPRAIAEARQALRLNREHLSSHRVLAIALQLSGRHEEACAAVAELLRRDPRLTVADYIARSPGARSGLAEVFGQALGEAGVPAR